MNLGPFKTIQAASAALSRRTRRQFHSVTVGVMLCGQNHRSILGHRSPAFPTDATTARVLSLDDVLTGIALAAARVVP
ncbi:hypothetical protein GCM10007170_10480 [Arthrobacter liuii]|uniref:Uncharacterized protein n=1 Tax=Arthrobacter liuii TaxID=1476996 RepID=A0ABQ2AN87_9MICC|nr:hypothetical protein GCM10007170_10480 [Arthrobacter liuii]